MEEGAQKNTCPCPHHKMIPALIAVFGLLFLAGNLGWLSMSVVDIVWPLIIIVAGLSKVFEGSCKCC